jgi:twitching motility protein PilT
MPTEEVAALRARWFRSGRKEVDDATRFCEWLRANDYLTEFVIGALASGKVDWLTLNQYRLTDRVRAGVQAGDFLALDPLDHVVRVQIVSPTIPSGPAWYEKFRSAVGRLTNLQHPGVARVLDFGQARGIDYLVSEFTDGESLEDVLRRRGKLKPDLAARIFALVFDALQALHEGGVPAGELGAEYLIFASTDKASGGGRTVRLINAGFPRRFFDSSALGIGGPETRSQGLRRGESSDGLEFDAAPRPAEDIARLGLLLYRCVSGQELRSGRPIPPVRQAATEVPELLAELIDSLVDAVPENRPRSAAAVAKALRVFLRTEEEQSPTQVEERVVVPMQSPAAGRADRRPREADRSYRDEAVQAGGALLTEVEDWRRGPGVAGEPAINQFFRAVIKHQGSDLHLAAGLPPMLRVRNTITHMGAQPLEAEELEELVQPILSERSRNLLEEAGGADFAHIVGRSEGRFRVNLFKQRGQLSLVARRVNASIPTFDQLRLPPVLEKLCLYDQGMVILAGVTGSGKSTTLAAMLEYINEREQVHILTIEDPIEYLFTSKKAVVNQREVGIDVRDWSIALKHAVRQDPDVILVGEMRDRETFEAGLNAAETGHLVFCTVHASSAPSTIGRVLDLFPADMHPAMRQSLAFNLKAIVCQKLLRSIRPGIQRVPANEIMIVNPTIRELLIKGEDKKFPDAIRIGYIEGMVDFNESLRQLVTRGDVDEQAALEVAPNPDALKMALKGIRVSQPGIL